MSSWAQMPHRPRPIWPHHDIPKEDHSERRDKPHLMLTRQSRPRPLFPTEDRGRTWTSLERSPGTATSTQHALHKHLVNKQAHGRATDIRMISWENRKSVIELSTKAKTDTTYGAHADTGVTITGTEKHRSLQALFSTLHRKRVHLLRQHYASLYFTREETEAASTIISTRISPALQIRKLRPM